MQKCKLINIERAEINIIRADVSIDAFQSVGQVNWLLIN